MRAVRIHRYGGPEVLSLDDVPEPGPLGPRDVLVRVRASSVNPIDTKIRAGGQRGAVRLRLPWILGFDVAGEVLAVGGGVTRFRPGDAVIASPTHKRPGCWAEQVVIEESALAPKPARWSFAEAATLPLVGLTAWRCFVDVARLQPGQRVLVQAGAGGVGTVAIQLAKHLGAWVATTASAANGELVRSLGADLVIDHRAERFEEKVEGLDVVLESVGGEVLERSVRVLRRGGMLTSITSGLPESTKRWGPNLGLLATGLRLGSLAVRARLGRGVRVVPVVRACDGAALTELSRLADTGVLRPVVETVLPLERIADAHRAIETGRTRGKIGIEVG